MFMLKQTEMYQERKGTIHMDFLVVLEFELKAYAWLAGPPSL
jgi:hypothetical protein